MQFPIVIICCSLWHLVGADGLPMDIQVPREFQFEPHWREPADCGPLALYALMKLKNIEVTLPEVKRCFHLDPQLGCSLEDMRRAAEELGMACEIRYVNPTDMKRVRGPFILHGLSSLSKNIGHFTLILGYEEADDVYDWMDTDTLRLGRNPAQRLLAGYTGYLLMPIDRGARVSRALFSTGSIVVGLGLLVVCAKSLLRRPRTPSPM